MCSLSTTTAHSANTDGNVANLFTYADGFDLLASLFAACCLAALGFTMIAFLFFLKPFFTDVSAAESAGGGVPMTTVEYMSSMILMLGGVQLHRPEYTSAHARGT